MDKEVRGLIIFIAKFDTLDHQYSFPHHSLERLEKLTNKRWTLDEVREEYKKIVFN